MNVVVSQALASGLPVVTTIHSGLPEQVHHGENGLLVPEGDAAALAGAIVEMIDSADRWADFGRAGRAIVEQHYNADTLIDRQVELYRQVLGR